MNYLQHNIQQASTQTVKHHNRYYKKFGEEDNNEIVQRLSLKLQNNNLEV